MRLRELLTEKVKKLPRTQQEAGVSAKQFSSDNNFYSMYRLGLAMATQPHHDIEKEGPGKDMPTIYAYTDADAEIIKKAAKNMGVKGKTIVDDGPSSEMPDTNTVSPMKPQGPIKRKGR